MARYRRVARRRFARKPVRRRRVFKRRYRKRTTGSGCLFKFTRTIQLEHPTNVDGMYSLHTSLDDYAEHQNLAPNFEMAKVLKVITRVHPHQNVSNNSTSRVGSYCLLPYHRVISKTVNFPTALSVDRAKTYRSTAKGRLASVPCTRINTIKSTGAGEYSMVKWRPTIDLSQNASSEALYCGYIVFENIGGSVDPPPPREYYTIIQEIYVKYYTQRSFI